MKSFSHPIRLVLADDYPLFRQGFRSFINQCTNPKVNILAEAANGKELVRAVEDHKPDMVVTDIRMPLMNGIEATKIISQKFKNISVIALSMSSDKQTILTMYQAGAKGYLLKVVDQSEILKAIETVYRGDNYFCSHTSSVIASLYLLNKSEKNKIKIHFSDKEVQIIELICRQFTTKQIADTLCLSTRTIDDYRYKIQEKMEVRNMVGIAMYAAKNSIININEVLG